MEFVVHLFDGVEFSRSDDIAKKVRGVLDDPDRLTRSEENEKIAQTYLVEQTRGSSKKYTAY